MQPTANPCRNAHLPGGLHGVGGGGAQVRQHPRTAGEGWGCGRWQDGGPEAGKLSKGDGAE